MGLHEKTSLDRLYDWLRSGSAPTQKEISERLGVSERQVRRLLDQLEEAGVDLQERWRGRQKEYYLKPDDWIIEDSPINFGERQLLALIVAAESARSALRPTPLDAPLQEAFEMLLNQMPAEVITVTPGEEPAHWHFSEAPSVDIDPEVFDMLRTAIHEQRTVTIDYYTASTGTFHEDRPVDPLLVGAVNGSWLCAAYCHWREAVRDFNLVDIRAIDWAGASTYFTPPPDFDPDLHFKGRFGAVAGEDSYVVRLRADADVAPYFHRKKYHPTQQIEEELESGDLIVSYDVEGIEEIRAWIRSWGPQVEVLAPETLANRIRDDAQKMTARYGD